ncbi:MAG: hypothetical protein ORN85_05375 [Sediminibacterium sp.]|nr:hypothetical protein [Sediminibacterium sp.]
MIPAIRQKFNANFTDTKYQALLAELETLFPGDNAFKSAETPVFIPRDFKQHIEQAAREIFDFIKKPNFKELTQAALPKGLPCKNEGNHPECLVLDFGACEIDGLLIPQLIEMQGFPSLFAYQVFQDRVYRKHFDIPKNFKIYFSNQNESLYLELLRKIIIADCNQDEVVLLEIYPEKQKTRVDFKATTKLLGISIVCLSKIIQKGSDLFYELNGNLQQIKRIYNRVIFDDIEQQFPELNEKAHQVFYESNVKFVPHPAWFYRISKYTLPFIESRYVPKTFFLNQLSNIPTNLEDYVLKPLFSFAGQGVKIHVTKSDIEQINDKENWILQKKVNYKPIIQTPDGMAKFEIRLFIFWPEDASEPTLISNLTRLSKGDMIGVRYNQDKTWVGSTTSYFEE